MRLTLDMDAPVPGASRRTASANTASLADVVYTQVKQDLYAFRLLPGDHFTEAELVGRLGVSRTPVRQALYRLEREGFVLVHLRSGWQVRPFDFERFENLYDVRIVLEQASVERLCTHAGPEPLPELEALKAIWLIPPAERLRDCTTVASLDEGFHNALVTAAGNPEMLAIHQDVTDKIRIIRQLDFTKDFRIDATYQEHAAILRAIFARRTEECKRMLKSHIEMSKAEVRKITLHRLHTARDRFER